VKKNLTVNKTKQFLGSVNGGRPGARVFFPPSVSESRSELSYILRRTHSYIQFHFNLPAHTPLPQLSPTLLAPFHEMSSNPNHEIDSAKPAKQEGTSSHSHDDSIGAKVGEGISYVHFLPVLQSNSIVIN